VTDRSSPLWFAYLAAQERLSEARERARERGLYGYELSLATTSEAQAVADAYAAVTGGQS